MLVAPSSMRAGEPVRATLQRQVRGNDRLIVVASTASLASEWVRLESREALAREAEGETVIVPLRIDDAVMTSRTELARDLRRRSIADFTGWQRARAFAQAVDGLARSLEENAPTPDAP